MTIEAFIIIFIIILGFSLYGYINYYKCDCGRRIRFSFLGDIIGTPGETKTCKCGTIWKAEDGYASCKKPSKKIWKKQYQTE